MSGNALTQNLDPPNCRHSNALPIACDRFGKTTVVITTTAQSSLLIDFPPRLPEVSWQRSIDSSPRRGD